MRVATFVVSLLVVVLVTLPDFAQAKRGKRSSSSEGSSISSMPAAKSSGSKSSERPSRYFRNCSEARASGAGPIRRGAPGYGSHLDRDGDGIACEPYRKRR